MWRKYRERTINTGQTERKWKANCSIIKLHEQSQMNALWETRHKHEIVFKYNKIKYCRRMFFWRTLLCHFPSGCTAACVSPSPPLYPEFLKLPRLFFSYSDALLCCGPRTTDHILINIPCWWRVRRYEHFAICTSSWTRPAWFSFFFFFFCSHW